MLHSAITWLNLTIACNHGGCDFSVVDCMCGEKHYLILMEPVEGEQKEAGNQRIQDHKKVPDISLWRDHVKGISSAEMLNLQLIISLWIESSQGLFKITFPLSGFSTLSVSQQHIEG